MSRRPPLRKALGQHHLRRGEACAPLVDFLAPQDASVFEVGPGAGALTERLLAAGAREVVAWELDPAWAFTLRTAVRDRRLRVVVGDALEAPWSGLERGTRVAGNLPYNVATAIIDRVLDAHERIPLAAFLVQLEVAQRLAASPGDHEYGSTSVLTRARADVSLLGRVRPGAFQPPPKVDSAFVGLRLRSPAQEGPEWNAFRTVVRAAFSQRRKTLRNALASVWGVEAAESALAELGWEPRTRAEALGLTEFAALQRALGLFIKL